jgi:hypothetical protein
MQTVTLNNRQYQVASIEKIEGALAEDLMRRGWYAGFFTLVGKRGGVKVCLRSIKTGEFTEF